MLITPDPAHRGLLVSGDGCSARAAPGAVVASERQALHALGRLGRAHFTTLGGNVVESEHDIPRSTSAVNTVVASDDTAAAGAGPAAARDAALADPMRAGRGTVGVPRCLDCTACLRVHSGQT